MENAQLIPFGGKEIRKTWHNEQWYFSIFDVIAILTDTTNPKRYWNDLKRRDLELDKQGGTQISYPLKMQTTGGKQSVLCANTEGIFRIVMSVPSPKAEPLKLWLAEQGKRTIDETEDPELGFERLQALYKAKGYPDDWIPYRIQNIDTRKQLTDEWKNRNVKEGQEYSVLTAIIAKGTFGLNPSEHKKLKGLEKPAQNLRDHMTTLELIFSSLGEETTRILAAEDNAQGFDENKDKAIKGGQTAGKLLNTYEKDTGIKVVSDKNYLKTLKGGQKDALSESSETE